MRTFVTRVWFLSLFLVSFSFLILCWFVLALTVFSFFTTLSFFILHHLRLVSAWHMMKLNTLFWNKPCIFTVSITTSHFLNNCRMFLIDICLEKSRITVTENIKSFSCVEKCCASETSKVCNSNSNFTFTLSSTDKSGRKCWAKNKKKRRGYNSAEDLFISAFCA